MPPKQPSLKTFFLSGYKAHQGHVIDDLPFGCGTAYSIDFKAKALKNAKSVARAIEGWDEDPGDIDGGYVPLALATPEGDDDATDSLHNPQFLLLDADGQVGQWFEGDFHLVAPSLTDFLALLHDPAAPTPAKKQGEGQVALDEGKAVEQGSRSAQYKLLEKLCDDLGRYDEARLLAADLAYQDAYATTDQYFGWETLGVSWLLQGKLDHAERYLRRLQDELPSEAEHIPSTLRRLDRLAERPECRANVQAIKQWFGKAPPPLAREEMLRLRAWWKALPRHGAGWQPALKQALGVEGAEPSDEELSRLPTVGVLKLSAAIRDAEPLGMLAGLRSLTFQGGFRQPTPPVTEAVWRALVAFPLRKLACGPVEGRLAGIEALADLEYLKIADPDVASFELLRPLERLATLVIAYKQPPATPFSLAPIGCLAELREIVITGCPVKDLAALGGCARLHVLRLDECHLDSLADLPRLPMLTKASFSENRIRSVAPLLEQPQLVELGLEGNPLKDAKLLKARRGLRVEL